MTTTERELLATKFNLILDTYINAEEVKNAFGYSSSSNITKLRNNKRLLTNPHIQLLDIVCHIPTRIFDNDIPCNNDIIDKLIEEYQQDKSPNNKTKNSSSELLNLSEEAQKTLKWLKGTWYSYSYPSQPHIVSDGIWIMKTTIHEDLSITDEHGNSGIVHIRKKETYIEKETKETGELILIRFPNHQIPYKIFLFSVQSNQLGTEVKSMLNFGFYARKLYRPEEAKRILGEIEKVQLKLDLGFSDRIVENYKY